MIYMQPINERINIRDILLWSGYSQKQSCIQNAKKRMQQRVQLSNQENTFNIALDVFKQEVYDCFLGDIDPLIKEVAQLKKDLSEHKIDFIACTDIEYPTELFDLEDFPTILYYMGNSQLLSGPKLSIVGTRQPSGDGYRMCQSLGQALANRGVCAISGLAFGIDAAVHKAMLRSRGKTIAILPGGLDAIVPKSHLALAHEIVDSGGLLISEVPLYTCVQKYHYIKRNRLIAALSDQVVIIEAGIKSGTMSTAQFALQCNRNVYAMPGATSNPVAQGTNRLIRDGALVLLEPEDILCQMNLQGSENEASKDDSALSDLSESLLALIRLGGVWDLERLSDHLNKAVHDLLPELMQLVLDERLEQNLEGYYLC